MSLYLTQTIPSMKCLDVAIEWPSPACFYSPQFISEVSFLYECCSCHRNLLPVAGIYLMNVILFMLCFASYNVLCLYRLIVLPQECLSTFTKNVFSFDKSFFSVPEFCFSISKTLLWRTQMSSFYE